MPQPRHTLFDDRFFEPDPAQRRLARELYRSVAGLALICPHGHVDPRLLADENATFGTPADLFIIPDHYVFRALYAQGVPLESLGLQPIVPSGARDGVKIETDHRQIWQIFADHFYLFRGTPTGVWLTSELYDVFGIQEKLGPETALTIYDQIEAKLETPDYRPRALFERFNIETLCTTDFATDSLEQHQHIRASAWQGDVRPTFRPDDVTHLHNPRWRQNIGKLGQLTGIEITSFPRLIQAIETRRAFFREMGAVSTDTDGFSFSTGQLSTEEAERLFQRAMRGESTPQDAGQFFGHMLMESARMSIEDGLVMQVHFGSSRNHNQLLFERFGPDKGCDIPRQAEFTRNLQPLLNRYGRDPRLALIVFSLDEAAMSRELAPMAGHYPALKIGPPWWFFDSPNGMARYLDQVVEIAGLYNTVGFNDDTRAFPSIPARHDLWRRVTCNWLAGMAVRGLVDEQDAQEMAHDTAYRLAKHAYRL
jgi:glucuronate isomerase